MPNGRKLHAGTVPSRAYQPHDQLLHRQVPGINRFGIALGQLDGHRSLKGVADSLERVHRDGRRCSTLYSSERRLRDPGGYGQLALRQVRLEARLADIAAERGKHLAVVVGRPDRA